MVIVLGLSIELLIPPESHIASSLHKMMFHQNHEILLKRLKCQKARAVITSVRCTKIRM